MLFKGKDRDNDKDSVASEVISGEIGADTHGAAVNPAQNTTSTAQSSSTTSEETGPIGDAPFQVLVTYTENGFEPKTVNINKGDTVRFMDQSTNGMWVASNNHPTHSLYPEKSASDCAGSSFDTCRVLKAGEFWEFTFNKVGTWRYHNHMNPSDEGTVVVK